MVTDSTGQADDTTSFLRAARSGNLERVIEYLDTDIDINTANSNGLNALHLASKDGHVEIVTELLKRGAKVDAATKKGNTALHIASLAGQTEIVNILIQYGAAVNIQSQNGFTPLYMAAQENHDHVVKLLLHNGANQSLATEDGFTPLAVAMQQGHDKVVSVLLENDSKGKVRLPALHIAARKDDCKAAELLLQNDHKPDVTSKSGFTPLHIAAHYGNEDIARLLIKRGADVNYLAKHNISPLHVAAKWGKNNLVKILLENSAIIDAKTRDGLTPLHCAARSGHEQVISTLLEHSAPISARTKNGLAPLHMASQGDHVGAARVLLYHRAPVDEVTIDYLTSLHVAAHCGHVRVAKLLIDRKADPNARALNGFTPLHIACKKNRIKVVELLLKHGASIESTTESGLTPLHVASFMGCMNIVIFLLQHEANPDVPTVRGETPLHLAARANQTDIIRILLRNGAKVDARARELQTPLHIAARLGNVDIVSLLLQHGAVVDTATKDMYTALHVAAKEGQEEVAAILLDNNASINATTTNGLTPLHFAAKYGNMNVAKLLLQKDSKLDAQDKYGITPLHLACHYNHPNVAQLLLDKGASPRIKSQNCHTPLHIVARKNQMDIATTLLEHGANPNEQSRAGFTPLHLSAQRGHYDMTNLLIEHGADPNKQATNGLTALHLCAQEDFTKVASVLVNNGADVGSKTVTDFRPIHVAAHFGNLSMVRFLLKHNAEVDVKTSQNYTPLHQAAQQGHAHVVSALIEANAWHRARTNDGLTALNIAQKLGYISVMEVLKGLSYDGITPDNKNWEEKYKVIAPESLQETSLMSDSEDEGGSEALISEQPYQYLTLDLMKSLQDDSLPIDVTGDDPTHKQQLLKQKKHEFIQSNNYCYAENFDSHDSSNTGLQIKPFLVSFLVDARGGTMKGCRHSGIRILVPPGRAPMPIRVTCKLVKPSKLLNPPPQMDGEALATRIVEMGPVGVSFLGPVLIDIPHSASVTGKEREIIILKSENGESWKEHDNSTDSDDALMNASYDAQMSQSYAGRITRIITREFPQYFAVITRIRQEVHVIGAEGGILISSVAENCQAVFPPGALTKKIKVGLQAHVIPTELTSKLLGNCVAVSPVVTIEPRRRKFHKPITITMPVPQAANKGMINQYAGETPTLRLLYSIAGGTSEAHWEDVTGSTPLTFMNDRISFTTTVSARFLLIDCRNIHEVPKMATELYRQSLFVPFVTNFIIYSKRVDIIEATLRILCMTDGKEGTPTLEKQEEFKEIVKSRDVDALDGKDLYIEFTGNLVPVTKSGSQLRFTFKAFRQNRLSFHVKVKDPQLDPVARMLFMREPKVAKGEPAQQPVCVLNILLPEALCRQSKTEGTEDSNIISQKIDSLKTKRKEENEEKRDYPKSTSPSEKKFITDTLQKEHSDGVITRESLAQKAACSLESVDASYPDKVSGQDDISPSIEHQTYSEKRKFWEDIARKRDSYQRSESEFSRTSQLTYNESDSDYLQNVISEDETEAMSGEIKSEIAEDVNVPDISECTVAEKAHYFEEQIQRELSTISQLPKKPSITEGMSKTISQESELSLVSDKEKVETVAVVKETSVEKEPVVEPMKEKSKELVKEKELKLTEKESLKKEEKKVEKESKKGEVRKGIEQALKDVKKSIFSIKKDKQPGKSEKKKEQETKTKEKEKDGKKAEDKKKETAKDVGKKEKAEVLKEEVKKTETVEETVQEVQLDSRKVVEEKKIADLKKDKTVEKIVDEKKIEKDFVKAETVEKVVEEMKIGDLAKHETIEPVVDEMKIKEEMKKDETKETVIEGKEIEEDITKGVMIEKVVEEKRIEKDIKKDELVETVGEAQKIVVGIEKDEKIEKVVEEMKIEDLTKYETIEKVIEEKKIEEDIRKDETVDAVVEEKKIEKDIEKGEIIEKVVEEKKIEEKIEKDIIKGDETRETIVEEKKIEEKIERDSKKAEMIGKIEEQMKMQVDLEKDEKIQKVVEGMTMKDLQKEETIEKVVEEMKVEDLTEHEMIEQVVDKKKTEEDIKKGVPIEKVVEDKKVEKDIKKDELVETVVEKMEIKEEIKKDDIIETVLEEKKIEKDIKKGETIETIVEEKKIEKDITKAEAIEKVVEETKIEEDIKKGETIEKVVKEKVTEEHLKKDETIVEEMKIDDLTKYETIEQVEDAKKIEEDYKKGVTIGTIVEEMKIEEDIKKGETIEKVGKEKMTEEHLKKDETIVEGMKIGDLTKYETIEQIEDAKKIEEDSQVTTIEKFVEAKKVEEMIHKLDTKEMKPQEEIQIIIDTVQSAKTSFDKEEDEKMAQEAVEKSETTFDEVREEQKREEVKQKEKDEIVSDVTSLPKESEPTKSPEPVSVKDEERELEALKTQAEKEIERIFTTKIEEKRISQTKLDLEQFQPEKTEATKLPKKESRIPVSASMAEKEKKGKKEEDKPESKAEPEVKHEFESKIPKRITDKSAGKSEVVKSVEEVKPDKVQEQVSRERFGFSPEFPKAKKGFEEAKALEGKVTNVISKVDKTELMTHETKEIKSSQITKGAEKTLLHEEREHVAKKETLISSVTKHSPDEILMETEKQVKELDTITTQRTAMNITDDRQIIDAQASGLSIQNKESQRTKLQEDKDKISLEESGFSKVKAKTSDVSLKIEKDLMKQTEDEIHPQDIFAEDKDISGYITEKSVQEDSHEESSESFSSKINLKARPQTLIPKKGLEWKDSSSVQSSIDEFVEEEQKLLMEESEAREVAKNLLQSIETELQSKSIEELRKVHSQDALDVDKSEDSLDDKLADKLTQKFESMLQKEAEAPSVTMKPIFETDFRRDSVSFSEEKDDSYALSSSQLRLQDRDITISPSSISEQIELEADLTANDVEGASKSLKSELASDKITPQVSSQSYYPETDQEKYEIRGIPKEYSELSGAKVLEILEPDIRSRQDSMDVPSLEIDDIKLIERVSQDFGMSRSQDSKDSSHSSFHESATIDAFERMYVDRDITISPSTVSEDTNLDYSLTREQRESISSRGRKGDSFEIESPPLISPRLKVKELEIKPVDWMIGDEKIEISETLQPSQAFDKELDEYQSKLSQEEEGVQEMIKPEITVTGDTDKLPLGYKSKFTVVPVNEQDLEKELIENRLDVSCQELVDTLQREHEAKTPTKEDRLDEFARLGDEWITHSEEEKSDEESVVKTDSQPDSLDAAIPADQEFEKSPLKDTPEKVEKTETKELEAKEKLESHKVDDFEKVETVVKKDGTQSPRMKHDDHKRLGDKFEKREKVGQSDVSAFKLTTENLQNVDLSAKYVITVLDQVVKKEIAEVKESLEAAKQDLIEELSENSETVLQIKDSPSEFQFTLQPEPIPNELPFLYRAPSSEHEDRDSVASGSPVTKPRKQDSKDVPETADETLKVKLVGETIELITAETEPQITVCEELRDEESPLPGSRSGSDPDKEDNLSLLTPQVAPRRKPRPPKTKKSVESEADISSSGESSQYQSCEYESGSRPSSSDIEALQSNQPSGTYSEYETALMSLDHSSDTRGTSQDYHTAVSSLSSRESMKSLNSLSSGHLGSIDSTGELSETLVASDAEGDRDDLDFNPDFNLEDDEVGELQMQSRDEEEEGSYEVNEAEVPYRMKRSSEMIFQQMSEDTTLEDQEVSEDMESYEFKSTLPSSAAMDQPLSLSKIPQRVPDTKPQDRYLEETSEYFSATYTKSGRQSPTLVSTSYDLRRGASNLEDETFDSAMTSSTLLQQASMSTSSASGISADTIVDKDRDRNSPDSDSFELVDKPDIIDDFVVIEEVGKEAEEFDAEGKSIRIDTRSYASSKTYDRELEKLLTETRKEEEALKESQSAPKPGNNELFELESEESPPQASNEDQYSQSNSDEEQYDGNKKWIEMQFHSDARMYEVEYDRGPLEDIKEEEITDFEAGSSRFGSLGSHKESIGSVGSMKGSFGSTPDYETLTKRYFIKPEHDNVSLSSLQEFEHLETAIAMENSSKKHSGSQDSSSGNGSFPRRYVSKSGHGDDVSLSSLKDFEKLESACKEAHMIELKAREEQELLDHESPENRYKLEMARAKLESSSRAASVNPSTSGSDDYEKRVKEIEEIIRVAQANVEKLERQDDTQEDISQLEEMEKATSSVPAEAPKPAAEVNIMETSTDSLELEDNGNQKYNAMCRSSDSLELKTTLDYPSLSSDSLNNVKDAKESQLDSSERYNTSRRISSDSLELPDQEGDSHSHEIEHESNIPHSDRQLGDNVHESSSQPKP